MEIIKNSNLIPPSPQIDINTLKPFTKFCCSIGAIPASYLVTMSYEEQLLWLCNFLENTVIPTVNNNAEAVTELQGLFIELKNYVDDYFNNLDFQEEINNKLDEMAQSGYFESILLNYTKISKVYNSTLDLINDSNNLVNNQKVKTLGYYSLNDGGTADFIITNFEDNSTFQINLGNNLFASLIINNNTINIRQLGARSEYDTNFSHFDIKSYIQDYLNIQSNKKLKLYIPSGIWCCSELLISNTSGFNIFGDKYFNYRRNLNGTVITAINNNQKFIWKIGGNSDFSTPSQSQIVSNFTIENIYFQSVKYSSNFTIDEYFHVDYALVVDFAQMGILNDLNFGLINGGALEIISSWEIISNSIIFRHIGDFLTPKLYFTTPYSSIGTLNPNITALNFKSLYFEAINGSYIFVDTDANINNSRIGYINVEESFMTEGNSGSVINKNDSPTNTLSMFQFENGEFIIDDISIQNFGNTSYQVGENIYSYTSIFATSHDSFQIITINNIHVYNFKNPLFIFKADNNNFRNIFTIVNFIAYSESVSLNNPTDINNYACFDILNFKTVTPNRPVSLFDVYKNRIFCYKSVVRIQNNLSKYITTDNSSGSPLKLVASSHKSTASYKPLMFLVKSSDSDLILRAKGDYGVTYTVGLNDGSTYRPFNFEGTGNFENYSFKDSNSSLYNAIPFDKVLTITDDTNYSSNSNANSLLFDYFIFK